MASGTKMNIDSQGKWVAPSTHDRDCLTPLHSLTAETIMRKMREFKPILEWSSGVVCLTEVRCHEPGNPVGFWVMPSAYDLPMEAEKFASDMFDLSLTHDIVGISPSRGTIYVMRSDDGQSNITEDVMSAVLDMAGKPINTLSKMLFAAQLGDYEIEKGKVWYSAESK